MCNYVKILFLKEPSSTLCTLASGKMLTVPFNVKLNNKTQCHKTLMLPVVPLTFIANSKLKYDQS